MSLPVDAPQDDPQQTAEARVFDQKKISGKRRRKRA